MYYRKSMFDEAGIPIPQTWEEFVAAAKALTKDDVKGTFFGNDGGVAQAYVLAHAAGHEMIKDNKIDYNNPDVAAALTAVRAAVQRRLRPVGAPTDWYDPTVLNAGLAASQWGGLWMMPAVQAALGDDFVVGPVAGRRRQWRRRHVLLAVGLGGQRQEQERPGGQGLHRSGCGSRTMPTSRTSTSRTASTSRRAWRSRRPPSRSSPGSRPRRSRSVADHGFVDSVYYSGAVSTPYVDAVGNIVKNGADATTELDKAAGSRAGGAGQAPEPLTDGHA